MSATTDIQLGGTKKRASLSANAKAKRARARKLGNKTRVASAAKVGRAKSSTLPKVKVASTKSGIEVSQDRVVNGVGTTAINDVNGPANDSRVDSGGQSIGARSSSRSGNLVKAHTEAGKKRLVNRLLGLAEAQATEGSFKITPADLIRLMQLHKELNPQKDRKVTVQWVEDRSE